MRGTASIRTVTLWRSSSIVAWHAGSWRLLAVLLLLSLVTLALTGCLHRNLAVFTPAAGLPGLTPAEMRESAESLIRLECPRVLASSPRTWGVATMLVSLDPQGNAHESELEQGTGDGRLDDLLGGLSASLRWTGTNPPPARARVYLSYSCSPTTGVSTIRVERAS
jgi:hypothetical protein